MVVHRALEPLERRVQSNRLQKAVPQMIEKRGGGHNSGIWGVETGGDYWKKACILVEL